MKEPEDHLERHFALLASLEAQHKNFFPIHAVDPATVDTPAQRKAFLKTIHPEQARSHPELIRAIFLKEMDYRRRLEYGETTEEEKKQENLHSYYENIYWTAYLLYHVGDPADVAIMWDAKHVNMDVGVSFDAEAMFGAGIDETISYLHASGLGLIAEYLEDHREMMEGYFPNEDWLTKWSENRKRYYY